MELVRYQALDLPAVIVEPRKKPSTAALKWAKVGKYSL
jgi:hypothetical protein